MAGIYPDPTVAAVSSVPVRSLGEAWQFCRVCGVETELIWFDESAAPGTQGTCTLCDAVRSLLIAIRRRRLTVQEASRYTGQIRDVAEAIDRSTGTLPRDTEGGRYERAADDWQQPRGERHDGGDGGGGRQPHE